MLLAFLCLPATAFGQVNAKTAVTMMQQAAKAYEAGDFAKAAEWYGKAWRLDPLPAYLWALARAEHLGAMFEPATEHYREFIALPAADAARVAKAHQYLVETEAEAVKTRVRDADAATSGGKPALAAELYLRALKVFPTRLDLLFNAAVAEQMAEQWQPALAHQDEYLGKAPADAPDRPQALTRRGWLRQKLGLAPQAIPPPVAVSPPPVVPSVVVKPVVLAPPPVPAQPRTIETVVVAQPEVRSKWPAWTLLGGGAALVVGGVVLLVGGMSDAAALNAAVNHAPGTLVYGLTYDQATSRASSANTRIGVGAGLAGAGLAAAGVGTWLLLRHDGRQSAVLPTPNGVVWVARF